MMHKYLISLHLVAMLSTDTGGFSLRCLLVTSFNESGLIIMQKGPTTAYKMKKDKF